MQQININLIFNNMKQEILVEVFILVKLLQMNLKRIKAICQKIQQTLIINVDQKTKKAREKKRDTFDSVNALYEAQELTSCFQK